VSLPPGGSRGKIQPAEEHKPVERVVPITLTNTREGRSRSRDKANNPFLEPSGLSTRPGDDKAAEAKLPATKIAPLATAEGDRTENGCYACDVCTQTEVPTKKGCSLM